MDSERFLLMRLASNRENIDVDYDSSDDETATTVTAGDPTRKQGSGSSIKKLPWATRSNLLLGKRCAESAEPEEETPEGSSPLGRKHNSFSLFPKNVMRSSNRERQRNILASKKQTSATFATLPVGDAKDGEWSASFENPLFEHRVEETPESEIGTREFVTSIDHHSEREEKSTCGSYE